MFEKLTYINHLNEEIVFGEGNILVSRNDIRDYEWGYETRYNKVLGFKRGISQKSLPVLVFGENKTAIANRMFEVIEKDLLAGKAGKLYVGDYYLSGYFNASRKKDYNDKYYLKTTLKFVTTQYHWIHESTFIFREGGGGSTSGLLDYPHPYPFDYVSNTDIKNFTNTGFVPSDFIIRIYGSVTNPSVIINGDVHRVYCELRGNEYLDINSMDKTIIRTTGSGAKVNEFANRDTQSYIFEKIPTGDCSVVINPTCNVDITLLEERSEPAWI